MTGIVILNFHQVEMIRKMVGRLYAFSALDHIVVVDNSQRGDEAEQLKRLENDKISVLVCKENGGYAKGNNVGLRYLARNLNCDMLMVANPDVVLENEVVEKTIQVLKAHPEYGAISAQMLTWDGAISPVRGMHQISYTETLLGYFVSKSKLEKAYLRSYPIDTHALLDQRRVWGSFFTISRKAAEECDYLDENTFLYFEEDILGKRLMRAGYKLGMIGDLAFIHDHKFCEETQQFKLAALKRGHESEYYMWKAYGHKNGLQLGILRFCQWLSVGLHRVSYWLRGIR